MKQNYNKGFSLIEVLIFAAIVSMFFVAAATIVSYMIRVSKVNEHKILATRYAEELLAWMSAERDIDWNAFTSKATNPNPYCVNVKTLTSANVWDTTNPCPYGLDNFFKRTITLQPTTVAGYTSEVAVNILVQWEESGKRFSVPINSTFTVWEQ